MLECYLLSRIKKLVFLFIFRPRPTSEVGSEVVVFSHFSISRNFPVFPGDFRFCPDFPVLKKIREFSFPTLSLFLHCGRRHKLLIKTAFIYSCCIRHQRPLGNNANQYFFLNFFDVDGVFETMVLHQ